MTGNIISLRQARKAKTRANKQRQAAENRAKFGRPRRERETTKADETLLARRLDAHRRETGDDEPAE
jgi:hypothetical protein